MFELFRTVLSNLLFFTLHLKGSGTFLKPLRAAEERELLARMKQNGDQQAREELIAHNLRLVAHVVKKYYAADSEQEDLISIGTIGLIKAIDSFNAEKGARLATYAARCIENEILMYFRSRRKTAGTLSLSEPIEAESDGDPLTLIDLIYIDDTVADEIDLKKKTALLYAFLEDMEDDRAREILILRYGLYHSRPYTQREIAQKMGISRSYVSRIEKKALQTLQRSFGLDAGEEAPDERNIS